MKVAELEGAQLDYWVAKAEDLALPLVRGGICYVMSHPECEIEFAPSTDWVHGGPIIERERIGFYVTSGMLDEMRWCASCDRHVLTSSYGATALTAAMRAYVASKFGDEVPDS